MSSIDLENGLSAGIVGKRSEKKTKGQDYSLRLYFRPDETTGYQIVTGWDSRKDAAGNGARVYEVDDLIVLIPPPFHAVWVWDNNPIDREGQRAWKVIRLDFPYVGTSKPLSYYVKRSTLSEEELKKIMDSRPDVEGRYDPVVMSFDRDSYELRVAYPVSEDAQQTLRFRLSEQANKLILLSIQNPSPVLEES